MNTDPLTRQLTPIFCQSYQKELASIYMGRLCIKQLKNDPVHKKIMQTKDTFAYNDDFDQDEAIQAAVHKRKHLIKKLLKDYSFNVDDNDQDD